MQVRFWGTRGSVATPGPETVRYGGNTACVEVLAGGGRAILDCGTGARALAAHLARTEPGPITVHLLLTHVHWDHIQGFPFFVPVLRAGSLIHVYGAAALEQGLQEALSGQMQYTYFPVRLGDLRARLDFHQLREETFNAGTFSVTTQYLNHTAPTMGYRVSAGGASVAYVTDHEPFWPHDPDLGTSLGDALMHPGERRHIEFARGVDLLIHDSQYTAEEYPAKRGWGHSTVEYVVDVAVAAGVRRLALFHHEPLRNDESLEGLLEQARTRARARGAAESLEIFLATEGQTVELLADRPVPIEEARATDALLPALSSTLPARVLLLGDPASRRVIREALIEDDYLLSEADADDPRAGHSEGEADLVLISLKTEVGVAAIESALSSAVKAADGKPVVAVLEGQIDEALLRRVAEPTADVIVAPVGPPNLRARVRAALARVQPSGENRSLAARTILLENLQVVDRLSGEQLGTMLQAAAPCGFQPGEVVFRQGERPTGVYYVRSGLVKIAVQGADGRELTVGFAGPGDTVGEMAALDGSPRSATAIALEPVEAAYISRDVFLQTLEKAPAEAVRLLRMVVQRLRDADQRIAALSKRDTGEPSETTDMDELRRSVYRLSSLMDLTRAVLGETEVGRLSAVVAARAAAVVGAEEALLVLPDAVTEEPLSSLGKAALQTGAPTRAEDGRAVAVPVPGAGGVAVAALVARARAGDLGVEDEELLAALAAQVGVALGNIHALELRHQESQRSQLLLGVMRALASELDLDALLGKIMASTTEALDADRSSLYLLDAQAGELWFRVAEGDVGQLREVRLPLGQGVAGHVAATGETVNIADAYNDPRFNRDADRRTGYRTRSMLCMPIRDADSATVGVLQVLNKHDGAFTEEDEQLLGAIGSQAAVALKNASLFEEVVRMKNYNESILRSMATGVLTLDMQGRLTSANPASLRILRLGDEAPLQVHFSEGAPGEANEEFRSLISGVLDQGESRRVEKARFTAVTEDIVIMNVAVMPLLDHLGRQTGVVVLIEDISREQQLMGTLTRVVSRQVAEQIFASGVLPRVGGERKNVTVLMADIRNFTTMAESADPEEIVRMLNAYFSRMIEVIFHYEGTVDKFIGDAIMAVFGTPVEHHDDPLRAVQAAIDMRRALIPFNEEQQAGNHPRIEIGVGVCFGAAISGAIGSEERMEFTVIGDTVNTASRLEGLTKQFPDHKILFNAEVYERIKDHLPCDSLGGEQVKGRAQAVQLYGISEAYVRGGAGLAAAAASAHATV